TLPTSTPCIFTLASGFITRPARGDTTVTGTLLVKSPRNRPTATAKMRTIATTVAKPANGRTYDRAPKWRPGDAATGAAALVVSERLMGRGPRWSVTLSSLILL